MINLIKFIHERLILLLYENVETWNKGIRFKNDEEFYFCFSKGIMHDTLHISMLGNREIRFYVNFFFISKMLGSYYNQKAFVLNIIMYHLLSVFPYEMDIKKELSILHNKLLFQDSIHDVFAFPSLTVNKANKIYKYKI
jgi:cell shape-determining protein MreD